MIEVGVDEVTDVRTGVTTRVPVLRDEAEVKAEAMRDVADRAWAEVDSAVDHRTLVGIVAMLARTVADMAAGLPVNVVDIDAVALSLKAAGDAIATVEQARTVIAAASTIEDVNARRASVIAAAPLASVPMATIATKVRR
jgi:hypothetical protein